MKCLKCGGELTVDHQPHNGHVTTIVTCKHQNCLWIWRTESIQEYTMEKMIKKWGPDPEEESLSANCS